MRARAPKPSPAPSGWAGSWCDAGAGAPASPQRLLVRAARTAVRLIACNASASQRAIDIDVVEHSEPEEVRTGVLALIEHDLDALNSESGYVLEHARSLVVALECSSGTAPLKADPAEAGHLGRCRWRVATDEVGCPVLQGHVETWRARSAVRAAWTEGSSRPGLTDVVAELGQQRALDPDQIGDCRGVVEGGARLCHQQPLVTLVARIPGQTGRIAVLTRGKKVVRWIRVEQPDGCLCWAANPREPASIHELGVERVKGPWLDAEPLAVGGHGHAGHGQRQKRDDQRNSLHARPPSSTPDETTRPDTSRTLFWPHPL